MGDECFLHHYHWLRDIPTRAERDALRATVSSQDDIIKQLQKTITVHKETIGLMHRELLDLRRSKEAMRVRLEILERKTVDHGSRSFF